MSKVMYQVPLYKLYKVVASCQFEEDAEFCPVLVKIIDETILRKNKDMPFLLQVWTNKGEMVFERPLLEPPANWNISGNKLVYLEETNSNDIYLVKLFMNKRPVLFKFSLPEGVNNEKININSKYDSETGNYVVPEDAMDNVPELEDGENRGVSSFKR